MKIVPKILFDQKLKYIIGLLMLVVRFLKDLQDGKEDSKALDGVVDKIHPLMSKEFQLTASKAELKALVPIVHQLVEAVEALFKK